LEVVFTPAPDKPPEYVKIKAVIKELDYGRLIRLISVHKIPQSIRVLFREMQFRQGGNLMEGDDQYVEAKSIREALVKLTNER